MKLKTYLKRRKMTLRAFAKKVGITSSAIHYYVTGQRTPQLGIALDIVKATDGEVTLRDLLDGKAEQVEEKDRAVA